MLFISLFYHQDQWHQLLDQLRLFLHSHQVNGKINRYWIFLSKERGDHIRLIVDCPATVRQSVQAIIERDMSAFFSRFPSAEKDIQFPIKSFFCDYAANSIRYNLFDSSLVDLNGFADVQYRVSDVLLNFYTDHPVDEDGVFTLLVHLVHSVKNSHAERQALQNGLPGAVTTDFRNNTQHDEPYENKSTALVADEGELMSVESMPDAIAVTFRAFEEAVRKVKDEHPMQTRVFRIIFSILSRHLNCSETDVAEALSFVNEIKVEEKTKHEKYV